jgi:hypothetical protein
MSANEKNCCFYCCPACCVFLLFVCYLIIFIPVENQITVVNDYTQDVLVTWQGKGAAFSTKRLTSWQSGSCSSSVDNPVVWISTQVYMYGQWVMPSAYYISSGVYTATYTVSQLRGPQQVTVTNDMEEIDVRVTYLTGNDTLCEMRLASGQSDSCLFHASQPVEQIFTLVCDKSIGKWSTPCYYTMPVGITNATYPISQIRRLETGDCFLGEGTPC